MKKIVSLLFLIVYACAPAGTAVPTLTPSPTIAPTATPDPLSPIISALQAKGITVVRLTENTYRGWELILNVQGSPGIAIPDAVLDENGFVIRGLDEDGNEVDLINIPLADLDKRAVRRGNLLIINDETGFPEAAFDAENPEAGWNFVDPEAKDGIMSLFEEHGFDFGSLDFTFEDGVIRGYAESGEMVFEDGKFDLRWAVLNMNTDDALPTKIKPGEVAAKTSDVFGYFFPRFDSVIKPVLESEGVEIPNAKNMVIIDPDKLAWAYLLSEYDSSDSADIANRSEEKILVYETTSGVRWIYLLDVPIDEDRYDLVGDLNMRVHNK